MNLFPVVLYLHFLSFTFLETLYMAFTIGVLVCLGRTIVITFMKFFIRNWQFTV